jgi:hypothetical protein
MNSSSEPFWNLCPYSSRIVIYIYIYIHRLIISVGSVGKDGLHASYSTPGASLFITAPGGDHENASNHITANFGGGCRDAGVGTSFACPVVSGVVALILGSQSRAELARCTRHPGHPPPHEWY